MYPPKTPMDGIYRVKILAVRQDDMAYYIRYDISVGPCVGWATYMYQQIQSLAQSPGHHVCLELHRRMDVRYIGVRGSLPVSAHT